MAAAHHSNSIKPFAAAQAQQVKLLAALQQRLSGVGFTFLIAAAGLGISRWPGFNYAGQMACAIMLAVLYRHFCGYPQETLRAGIAFSGKSLLRLAIILYGLKLNIASVFHEGLGLLGRDAAAAVFVIGCTMLLAKWLKADMKLSLLLGIGTGICGAAAIAAVSPIVEAKEEETALSAGLIALIGTVFAVSYTLLRPIFGLTDLQYAVWSGTSLHEIAHVALAAAPAGQDALALALLAKLGRVFLLVPLCLVLVAIMKRIRSSSAQSNKQDAAAASAKPIAMPWFLLGFMLMSLLGSSSLGQSILQSSPALTNGLTTLTTFLLTMAMVALGLNVNLKGQRASVLKPLLAMLITSLLLTFWTYFSVL
ncbi:YeiH family protein [Paenibacillus albus]|uniref:Putative sulfate exporter family transporter n=1 Tax=Paenibacillus albus TaxID=2495582 RepID=A0A3Q8X8N2_9BACL|nr:putative sulfate exporter family transporter [Paenibacillus albus]AZN42984.1 putative sulfate exporter family transporter [Paenibacillus albus]